MVATNSLGEQKLVTLATKSLSEILVLVYTLSCRLVYTQSKGCYLILMIRVSGMSRDGVYFPRESSFQKYAHGLIPSSE